MEIANSGEVRLTPEGLSDLIGLVYESALEETQWQSLLDELARFFPFTTLSVIGYNGDHVRIPYAVAGIRPPNYERVEKNLQIEMTKIIEADPGILELPLGHISDSRETWKGAFHQSTFYENVVRPMGFDHYLSLKFTGTRDRYATIALGVRNEWVDETCRMHELLKLLSPHIVRAAQLNRTVKLAQSAQEALTGFLDALVLPMLVVNARCDLLFSNTAGRRLLDRGELLHADSTGRLCCADTANTAVLRRKVLETDRDACPGGIRIADRDTYVSVCMTPFKPSMLGATRMDRDMIDQDRMFALFVGQHHDDAVSSGLLADVFALTPREAEVCRALVMSRTIPDIAEASGRSEKTIRNQVQSIYDKVDVSSHLELIEAMSVFRVVGSLFDSAEPTTPDLEEDGGPPDRITSDT